MLAPSVSYVLNLNKDLFLIRFIGNLKDTDVERGFEKISKALQIYQCFAVIQPLMNLQELLIFPDLSKPKRTNPLVHILMFFLTLTSVLFTGGLYAFEGELTEVFPKNFILLIRAGWPFALAMLSILAAHELGHYFAGKKHGVDVTLPLFIPFPLSLFGTMGAFISMRSIPKNKKAKQIVFFILIS